MTAIIIEGPDNVGKTTVARALVDVLGGHYCHMSRPGESWCWSFEEYVRLFESNRSKGSGPLIQDRFHFGAYAYQSRALDFIRLDNYFKAEKALVVLITPTLLSVYADHLKYSTRDEMFGIQHMVEAAGRFCQLEEFADLTFESTPVGTGFRGSALDMPDFKREIQYPTAAQIQFIADAWRYRQ